MVHFLIYHQLLGKLVDMSEITVAALWQVHVIVITKQLIANNLVVVGRQSPSNLDQLRLIMVRVHVCPKNMSTSWLLLLVVIPSLNTILNHCFFLVIDQQIYQKFVILVGVPSSVCRKNFIRSTLIIRVFLRKYPQIIQY